MPGPRDGTLPSRRPPPPLVPPLSRGIGRSRGGRPRPAWDPCRRRRPSEHLWRCLLPRKVGDATGQFVEVEPRLGANGRFQQGTNLADLQLQLAQQLGRPALDADHVPEDSPFRPARDQRLGQALDVDERATATPAILLDRNEGHDVVGPYVLTESEGDDAVGNNLHLDDISISKTLITSPLTSGDPPASYRTTQPEPSSPEAGKAWASAFALRRARCREPSEV